MNKPENNRKNLRDPLKRLDRQAYRRAFGEPDTDFHERVRDTLFLIREKEDEPVKKKMTFSMAFALVMCLFIATAALAGSLLPTNLPDNTLDPLSQSQNTSDPQPTPMPADSNAVTVYVDDGGSYYHTDYKCSGMTNPKKWQYCSIAEALNMGRTACSVCLHFRRDYNSPTPMPTSTPIASEPRTVYFTANGDYYHTDSTCLGMKNAQPGSVAQALNLGKTACPVCMDVSPTPMPIPMADSTLVYMTDHNGIYYHLDSDCMNMVGAYYTSFESMRNGDDRPACPLCVLNAADAPKYVWSALDDSYYHSEQSCSGQGSLRVTLAVAENRLQTACPTCIGSQEDTYYYRADGTFFHVDKSCSTLKNCEVSSGTLAQVKALDRTPCPNCYEPSSTDITYYGAPSPRSYHTQFSCAATAEYHASSKWYDRTEIELSFEEIFDPSNAPQLQPCADCVLAELDVPVEPAAAQSTDTRVPLMRNEAMEAPEGSPRAITINALDFDRDSVGTCSDLAVNFNCDMLTMHSTIMMHSRGAVYTEFEFTLNDPSIDPDTIRIVPYCEESGSLGCLWADVQEIAYDDGETGYLLCQMMNSPSLEYGADCFRLYVGEQMMAEFR